MHDSEAPLTVPLDPHLTTEARAAERAAFDHVVEEKMRLMEVGVDVEECVRTVGQGGHGAMRWGTYEGGVSVGEEGGGCGGGV